MAAGSFGSALRSPTFRLASATMSLRRLLVAAGERAQPAAEVVVQHERPAAEQLLGQELGEHAVARARRRRRCETDRRCCRAGRTPRSCRRNRGRRAATPTAGTRRAASPADGGARDQASCRQHLAQIGFEDRRRLLELIGEAGQMLQLADGLLGLPHALGGRIDLAAEEIRDPAG